MSLQMNPSNDTLITPRYYLKLLKKNINVKLKVFVKKKKRRKNQYANDRSFQLTDWSVWASSISAYVDSEHLLSIDLDLIGKVRKSKNKRK